MEYEAYIGYLDEQREAMAAGDPIVIEVRDRETFERLIVRALVAEDAEALPGADTLHVVDWIENATPQAWAIRVLEELDPDAARATRADIGEEDLQAMAEESRKYTGAKYRGSGLPDMMGQDEIRKYTEHVERKQRPS